MAGLIALSSSAFADPLDSWISRSPAGLSAQLNCVISTNGVIVVAGDGGTILTSQDGSAWASRTAPKSLDLYDIICINGTFYAGGTDNGGTLDPLLASSDAITWTNPLSALLVADVNSLAFGNGIFIGMGDLGETRSSDGINWQNIFGYEGPDSSVTFGNGQFVAVGIMGSVSRSIDGKSWSTGFASLSTQLGTLRSVTFAANLFVSVGDGGTIVTSPDAVNWTVQHSGTAQPLYAVTHGSGQFVAVGFQGTILSSPDGAAWTPRNSGTTKALNGIAFATDTFIAVGDGGVILQSASTRTPPTVVRGPSPIAVGVGDGVAFGVLASGAPPLSFQWIRGQTPIPSATNSMLILTNLAAADAGAFSVTVANALGSASTGPATLTVAAAHPTNWPPESSEWTVVGDLPTTNNLSSVAYGNGQFVAVGDLGIIIHSSDGAHWSAVTSDTINSVDSNPLDHLNGVAYGGGYFIAVGYPDALLRSSDGVHWTKNLGDAFANPPAVELESITYGNGTFLVAEGTSPQCSPIFGCGLIALTSNDPADWTWWGTAIQGGSLFGDPLHGNPAGFGNNRFVFEAWGADSPLGYSTDGDVWHQGTVVPLSPFPGDNAPFYSFSGIAAGGGTFVAAGTGGGNPPVGCLATSLDGSTWYAQRLDITPSIEAITYANGMFTAVSGVSGIEMSSYDGVTWAIQKWSPLHQWISALTCGNGTYVALGWSPGTVVFSGGSSSNSPGPVRLQAGSFTPNGFIFSLQADSGRTISLEASPDLVTWAAFTNAIGDGQTMSVIDTNAAGRKTRFYRAILLP